MQRRLVIQLLTALPLWMASGAGAQTPRGRIPRVGILGSTTAAGFASHWDAFRLGLRELGWIEGRDLVFEWRFADNQHERLPRLAAELVADRIDLLATHGIPGTRAAKGATTTIPILMASVADPVAAGLVSSFARLEGNVTGIAFLAQELAAKRLQLLKEAVPGLSRAAVLSNPRNPAFSSAMFEAMSTAAVALQLQLQRFDAPDPSDYAAVFAQMAARRMEAVAITEEATLIANAPELATLAVQRRLPSVGNTEFAQAGGLLGYGANRDAIFRRAAVLADKLLRGAKPADLPVEQPTQFELVLNARTLAALGLAVPPAIRLRSDRVID
ncbi:MAG: ABC transporter substrate-binding protein [Rhodoferax sp.]|nr:ABC transporter substrate-binding protein [Rhodoferax sp.]